jgi:hypothetical protein
MVQLIPWIVSVLIGLPALLSLVAALWAGCQRLPLYLRGRRVVATVLARRDTQEEFIVSGPGEHYHRVIAVDRGRMRIRFTDESGQSHTILYPDNSQRGRSVQLTSSGVSKDYCVGDELPVLYLPDDPKFCFIDSFFEIWGPVLVMALGSSAVLALCIVGLLAAARG